jgi:hypothetical protein
MLLVCFLITDVGQVIVEHAQGNQPAPDCCGGTPQTLLPFDEAVNVVSGDYFWRKIDRPLGEDPYIAGVMYSCTGTRFSTPPILFKAVNMLIEKHKITSESRCFSLLQLLTLVIFSARLAAT